MSTFYTHDDKESGDGLAITDWNELSNAVAGNQGLHLALDANDNVGIGTTSPEAKLSVVGGAARAGNLEGEYTEIGHGGVNGFINTVGDGNLEFRHDTTTKMALTSDGNLGIGTTSPGAKLSVVGSARAGNLEGEYTEIGHGGVHGFINTVGDGNLEFRHDTTTKMALTSDGNLGIGTTSPSAKLHIGGTIDDVDLNGSSGGFIIGDVSRGHLAMDSNEIMAKSNGTTASALYLNSEGGNVSICRDAGNVGIGTTSPSAKLEVSGKVKATHFIGNGASLTNLDASKITTGTIAQERLPGGIAVASGGNTTFTGNVGIGTTSPQRRLHILGHALIESQTGQNVNMFFKTYNDKTASIGLQDGGDQGFYICTEGKYRLSVNEEGNVGIGTEISSEKLEVRGNIRLSHSSSKFLNLNYNEPNGRFEVQMDTNSSYHGTVNNEYHNKVTWNGDNNWDFLSDKRLKKNISKVEDILDRFVQLQVVNYNWVYSDDNEPKMTGFVAQDVQPLFPTLVGETSNPDSEETTLTLKYNNFGVLAVGAIKELNDKLEKAIKESNNKFEKALEKLTKKVDALAKKVK